MEPEPGGYDGERLAARAIAWAVVRLASVLVPADRREDWRREWQGEIWARAADRGPLLGAAMGAVPHAWSLRMTSWLNGLTHLGRDLRYGARSLGRRPIFTLSATITLALGLGATTAVYSIVDAVLLAPMPYPGAERFVGVRALIVEWDQTHTLSDELWSEWRAGVRGFEALEAYRTHQVHLTGAGTPMIGTQARITPGFLSDLLGVRPRLGRLFDAAEARGDGPAVALISERLWRERFGSRSAVAGEVIRIDGNPFEIIGVLPTQDLLPDVDVWTPYRLQVDHSRTVLGTLVAIARLEPGVSREQAEQWLRTAHERAAAEWPASMGLFLPVLTDFRAGLVADVRSHLLLLFGAVVGVLLIACVNVTNLLLARGVERRHELAIRLRLGAGRAHLISQVLAEGILLALVGGAAGALLAWSGLGGIVALLPGEFPLATRVGVDLRVLGFTTVATLGTALLVGLLPLVRTGGNAVPAIEARGSSGPTQRRAANLLLGLEVAQAAALLVAAGLMVNTLIRTVLAPAGFEPRGLLFVHFDLPGRTFDTTIDPASRARFMDQVAAQVERIPGVLSVGIGTATPFSGPTYITGVEPEGGVHPAAGGSGISVPGAAGRIHFSRLHVDPAYLTTLGLPIVAGRPIREADTQAAGQVALINEIAARAYWPDGDALGRRIREPDGDWLTIVGVVADFGHPGVASRGMAELYLPLTQPALASPSFMRPTALVRYDPTAAGDVVEHVRRAIWEVQPDLAIPAIAHASDELGARLAEPRFYTLLLGSFAALALILAGIGVYGVVAHTVARRTRELGIRMALGARARQVAGMVLGEVLRVVVIGVAAGLVAGTMASRLLEGLLFGVEPTDIWTAAAVAALLLGVALIATLVPAWRALRSDPLSALCAD